MSKKDFPKWVPKVGQVIQIHSKYGDQERYYETSVSNRTIFNGYILVFVVDSGHHEDLEYFFAQNDGGWKAKLNLMPWEKDVKMFL